MANYKVIQDIEAEDKFLGPLTLKQFIFAAIAAICLYLNFLAATRGAWIILPFLLPPMAVSGFLGWPWGRDQPTEVWLLAKIRFFFMPRRRIWDQSGLSDLVTITAPKRVEHQFTDNLSQSEVKSRLRALADTIDSRGWAVKNMNVNLYSQPDYVTSQRSDRLVSPEALPQDVPAIDVQAMDDILDPKNNPKAQHLDQMMAASAQLHRDRILSHVQKPVKKTKSKAPPTDYWFLNENGPAAAPAPGLSGFMATTIHPTEENGGVNIVPTAEELAMLSRVKTEHDKPPVAYGHMKVIDPLGGQSPNAETHSFNHKQNSSVPAPDPGILKYASNNDLNIDTINRQANRDLEKQGDNGEVVIPLR